MRESDGGRAGTDQKFPDRLNVKWHTLGATFQDSRSATEGCYYSASAGTGYRAFPARLRVKMRQNSLGLDAFSRTVPICCASWPLAPPSPANPLCSPTARGMHVDRHEVDGARMRLYNGEGFLEMEAALVRELRSRRSSRLPAPRCG